MIIGTLLNWPVENATFDCSGSITPSLVRPGDAILSACAVEMDCTQANNAAMFPPCDGSAVKQPSGVVALVWGVGMLFRALVSAAARVVLLMPAPTRLSKIALLNRPAAAGAPRRAAF